MIMSERQAHRSNVHSVMLTAELEIALVKLQAKLEIGKAYAVLYGLVEGLFKLEYLSQDDYNLLMKRYSRKLVEVTKENRVKRQNSHVSVLALERQKEKRLLNEKDRLFKGQLDQWEQHPKPEWRNKALVDAQPWKDKLESARLLLEKRDS